MNAFRKIVFTIVCGCSFVCAQSQIITTVAGSGTAGYSGDGGPATDARVNTVVGIAADAAGNIYLGDQLNRRVRRVSPGGTITTICGTGTAGFSGDGGAASLALLGNIHGVATDASGNIYISVDGFYGERIRRINPAGIITTIAGTGTSGFSGDGGPATDAQLFTPGGMAADAAGNLYFADIHNFRIRRISSTGTITTIAGNGAPGYSGDGGPATDASLYAAGDVCVDAAGNVYFTDASDRIRKVSTTGTITTVAGTGTSGYSGHGGPATLADITVSVGICIDAAGNIYFADGDNHVRCISTTGIISTVAGIGTAGYSGDNCEPPLAGLNGPWSIAAGSGNTLYIGDNNNYRVRKMSAGNKPAFVAGNFAHLQVCNAAPASLDTILDCTDADAGQMIVWQLHALPAHGTAAASYIGTTSGGVNMPTGRTYTAVPGYTGPDTFSVIVKDCGAGYDTLTVFVTVFDPSFSHSISGADTLCAGQGTPFVTTAGAGSWSVSHPGIATVSAAGIVTGVAAGTVTLTCTATNPCGTFVATKTLVVRPAADCPTGTTDAQWAQPDRLLIASVAGGRSVSLRSAGTAQVIFTVRDMPGRRVAEWTARSNEHTTLPALPAGSYIISAQYAGGRLAAIVNVE